MTEPLPRLLEPADLHKGLDRDILVIDLCSEAQYRKGHIPGAVHVSPVELMDGRPPAPGKLPDRDRLQALVSRLGLAPDLPVVVYDDEGGGWAGRMIWTLDVIGHDHWSYLNGGLIAWANEGFPLEAEPGHRQPIVREISINRDFIADAEDILPNLGKDNFRVWDARSREEYDGTRVVAPRGGHIPGAVHCEWTTLMDPDRHYRIREDAAEVLANLGLTPERDIVTHCQSHHRSGFTYMVARILGYPRIRGYHGSWSEWGSRNDTPVETSQ